MSTPEPVSVAVVDEPVSLRGFFLAAVLWLPAAFFLWFMLRTVVVFPVVRLAGGIVTAWLPEIFTAYGQEFENFTYTVAARVVGVAGLPGTSLAVDLDANALIYCYGTAVLAGLVMATPLDWPRTFAQLVGGWLVLIPFQAFGLVGEALRDVGYNLAGAVGSGLASEGYAAVAQAAGLAASGAAQLALQARGLSPELIGLWYQFGYLILPSVAPVVIWIVFNRHFIERLAEPARKEPGAPARGQNSAT